jgi:nucleoside-diphosphate-sugar epimerase
MQTSRTALVLGATGGAGYEIARALRRRGWQIRALSRRPDHGRALLPTADWLKGDAMNAADVAEAAINADLIVHAVNPPGYRNWRGLALPMLANTIAAAKASGARILFPGTVYNYDPDAYPVLTEDASQKPVTRKGAIRVEMEEMLRHASGQGVRVVILRAGDFFGPHMTGNSWLSSAMVKPGKPVRNVVYPGKKGIGHAWAYLPDFAETAALLADKDAELAAFEAVHFAGHWCEDGREFARQIAIAAGAPDVPVRGFPWGAVLALSPFVRLFREMWEMKYLWDVPVRLDNARLVRILGQEPHTPLQIALQETLSGMGCLDGANRAPETRNLREC